MPAAQASVRTQNAATYLTRLCGHAGKMVTAAGRPHRLRARRHPGAAPQFSDIQLAGDQAAFTVDGGRCTLRAQPGLLTIRVHTGDQPSLQRIQDLLAARLHTISRREHLTISWQPAPDEEDPAAQSLG